MTAERRSEVSASDEPGSSAEVDRTPGAPDAGVGGMHGVGGVGGMHGVAGGGDTGGGTGSGRRPARRPPASQLPLLVLHDAAGSPLLPLTAELERLHGGPLGMRRGTLLANFVSSVDGVVALGPGWTDPGGAISGHSAADRFVMGLLRACSDAILVGAGTLRATPGHRWTPEAIHPSAGEEFAELRRRMGLAPRPRLIVVTARGNVDPAHPGLRDGGLILTTAEGAERLSSRLPAGVALRSLGAQPRVSARTIMEAVRAEGHATVLTEGGPLLVGELLGAGLLDELFLTISPVLLGRSAGEVRPGLVDALALAPARAPWLGLLSVRRAGDHLMVRYAVGREP